MPSGEAKKSMLKGQVELTKLPRPTTSGSQKPGKSDHRADRKEVCTELLLMLTVHILVMFIDVIFFKLC